MCVRTIETRNGSFVRLDIEKINFVESSTNDTFY